MPRRRARTKTPENKGRRSMAHRPPSAVLKESKVFVKNLLTIPELGVIMIERVKKSAVCGVAGIGRQA